MRKIALTTLLLVTMTFFAESSSTAETTEDGGWKISATKAHSSWQTRKIDSDSLICQAAEQALAAAKSGQKLQGTPELSQLNQDMCEFCILGSTLKKQEQGRKDFSVPRKIGQLKTTLAETIYGINTVEYWHALMDLAPYTSGINSDGKTPAIIATAMTLQLSLMQVEQNKQAIKLILNEHNRLNAILQSQIKESLDDIMKKLDKLNKSAN